MRHRLGHRVHELVSTTSDWEALRFYKQSVTLVSGKSDPPVPAHLMWRSVVSLIQKACDLRKDQVPDQPEQAVPAQLHAVETTRMIDAYDVFVLAEGDSMGPGVSWHRHTPKVLAKRILSTFLRGAP